MTDDQIVQTAIGPGHIVAGGVTADGRAGWLVCVRQSECNPWPYIGKFVYIVQPTEQKAGENDQQPV